MNLFFDYKTLIYSEDMGKFYSVSMSLGVKSDRVGQTMDIADFWAGRKENGKYFFALPK